MKPFSFLSLVLLSLLSTPAMAICDDPDNPSDQDDCDDDGYTPADGDCDDDDADRNPDVDEVCDDEDDNNCDGEVNEGCDNGLAHGELMGVPPVVNLAVGWPGWLRWSFLGGEEDDVLLIPLAHGIRSRSRYNRLLCRY